METQGTGDLFWGIRISSKDFLRDEHDFATPSIPMTNQTPIRKSKPVIQSGDNEKKGPKNGWFWRIYVILSPTNRIMMFWNGCLRLKISKFALFYHLWLTNWSRFVLIRASFLLVFACLFRRIRTCGRKMSLFSGLKWHFLVETMKEYDGTRALLWAKYFYDISVFVQSDVVHWLPNWA